MSGSVRGEVADLDARTHALHSELRAESRSAALNDMLECERPLSGTARVLPIVLVPGILYRTHPHTGADGAVLASIARRLGAPFHVVPIDGTDGLHAGARAIVDWLQANAEVGPCIVVSLSKGSAEMRAALDRPDAGSAFAQVRGWISVSGLPLGTPSFERSVRGPIRGALLRAWCRLKGFDLGALHELLAYRPDETLRVPSHLRTVHVAAFPQHVHLRDRRSRRLRIRLADLGPNDGFMVLEDLRRLPGAVVPVWGADHYLHGPSNLPLRLERLLSLLSDDVPDVGFAA